MADLEDALNKILCSDAALIAMVPAERIWSSAVAPGADCPYIQFWNVDVNRDRLITGEFEGVVRERWQFDVFAETSEQAKAIRKRLVDLLAITHQSVAISDTASVQIQGSFPSSYSYPRKDSVTHQWHAFVDSYIVATPEAA